MSLYYNINFQTREVRINRIFQFSFKFQSSQRDQNTFSLQIEKFEFTVQITLP